MARSMMKREIEKEIVALEKTLQCKLILFEKELFKNGFLKGFNCAIDKRVSYGIIKGKKAGFPSMKF